MRLLLVEDDWPLAAGLREGLEREAFQVDQVDCGEHALSALALTHYDLVLVDIGLPGIDGFELVRRLRRAGSSIPLLVLTARDALEDRVHGLDIGADDYLLKPVLLPELVARVRALIRRSRAAASPRLCFGALELDLALHQAHLDGAALELTGREWDVLEQLMLAAPKIVSKHTLAESLSRWDKEITGNAIEIYVSRLRGKLGAAVAIRTVRGIGYRLEEAVR